MVEEEQKPQDQDQKQESTETKAQGQSGQKPDEVTGVEPNKLMAALSYLGILVLIPLFVARNDKYVVFHAKQGLVILIGFFIAGIGAWMPLISIIANLLFLVLLVVDIIGLIQALQGKMWRIPGVADLADKFNI